jgi:hypothetical protein
MPPPPLCHLCGCRTAGSREHLPGVAATNDGPVEVTYLGPPRSEGGSAEHVTRTEPDGFVVRTICNHCNRRTGGNYGTAYKAFVQQFAASGTLDAGHRRTWISLQGVQPLRIVKQMASMFLSAQPQLDLERWADLRAFVLRRDRRLGDISLRFYVYRNVSPYGRVVPYTAMMSLYRRFPHLVLSEIAWPPVGIVYSPEPHPLLAAMKDVTEWGNYGFRDRVDLAFSVPQFGVATHWPLGFGSEAAANNWVERDGVIIAVARGDPNADTPPMPVVTRQLPPRRPAQQ